jgi:hypothetical protein
MASEGAEKLIKTISIHAGISGNSQRPAIIPRIKPNTMNILLFRIIPLLLRAANNAMPGAGYFTAFRIHSQDAWRKLLPPSIRNPLSSDRKNPPQTTPFLMAMDKAGFG